MKRDEAFELALQWRDNPELLVGDLRAAFDWLLQNSSATDDGAATSTGARFMDSALIPEVHDRLLPLHHALGKYTQLLKTSKLDGRLLEPVLESFSQAASDASGVKVTGLATVLEEIESIQRWVNVQQRLKGEEGNRSEILKTTIELAGDELMVNTDQDGSLKLRGSTNIPMFLAFFRTKKHHLSVEAFLDIDRTVKATNLDRHRVRLSSKLHDVYIEIVTEKDGYRMRKFR